MPLTPPESQLVSREGHKQKRDTSHSQPKRLHLTPAGRMDQKTPGDQDTGGGCWCHPHGGAGLGTWADSEQKTHD